MISSPINFLVFAGTYCTYPRTDGQGELTEAATCRDGLHVPTSCIMFETRHT